MQDQVNATLKPKRVPWNKGKLTGAKPPLRSKHVWSIRTKLQIEGRTRDLAMFDLAIDSKLRGSNLAHERPLLAQSGRSCRRRRDGRRSGPRQWSGNLGSGASCQRATLRVARDYPSEANLRQTAPPAPCYAPTPTTIAAGLSIWSLPSAKQTAPATRVSAGKTWSKRRPASCCQNRNIGSRLFVESRCR
jgi:hypothetical protein